MYNTPNTALLILVTMDCTFFSGVRNENKTPKATLLGYCARFSVTVDQTTPGAINRPTGLTSTACFHPKTRHGSP